MTLTGIRRIKIVPTPLELPLALEFEPLGFKVEPHGVREVVIVFQDEVMGVWIGVDMLPDLCLQGIDGFIFEPLAFREGSWGGVWSLEEEVEEGWGGGGRGGGHPGGGRGNRVWARVGFGRSSRAVEEMGCFYQGKTAPRGPPETHDDTGFGGRPKTYDDTGLVLNKKPMMTETPKPEKFFS